MVKELKILLLKIKYRAMKLKQISNFVEPIFEKVFGFSDECRKVGIFTLQNKNSMQLRVSDYGATVTSLVVPLKNGNSVDVVLGFDALQDYIDAFQLPSAPYFGAAVGRFAGRIANGRFPINQREVVLDANNGKHSLHGGKTGFSRKIWEVKRLLSGNNPSITLSLVSPDEDDHFPGQLTVELTYTLTEDNEFTVEYKAITTRDTVVNLTHHSYFNLDGHESSVVGQQITVNARRILETDTENIPTGNFESLEHHRFDFSAPRNCPHSIDNTFVLEGDYGQAASLFSEKNKLKMTVLTNQPAVHIYVGGNCFNRIKGKNGVDYHALSGICFETQNFPDAPNHEHFPSALLKRDSIYYHKTIYKFQSY